jgi:hypothetical protein
MARNATRYAGACCVPKGAGSPTRPNRRRICKTRTVTVVWVRGVQRVAGNRTSPNRWHRAATMCSGARVRSGTSCPALLGDLYGLSEPTCLPNGIGALQTGNDLRDGHGFCSVGCRLRAALVRLSQPVALRSDLPFATGFRLGSKGRVRQDVPSSLVSRKSIRA